MGSSRSTCMIDLAIEKKLSSSFVMNYSKKKLVEYSRRQAQMKLEALSFGNTLPNINLDKVYDSRKDGYDNELYSWLNFRPAKPQSRFNLIRLFKPGEILSSVSGN